MKRLLLMDEKNYDDLLPELRRTAVRGIVGVGGKMLFIESKYGELKLPGGGQEEGESDLDTLIREVREETGCNVIPESVRPFGYIEEKRMSFREEMIFHQFSRLYYCEVERERGECSYSKGERERGFKFVEYTLDEAIEKNRSLTEQEGGKILNKREYMTLLLIKEELQKEMA